MAPQSPTEKSRYPSRYSPGGFVTAAQYIIELVCEKYATKKDTSLPLQFWKSSKEWQTYYVSQTRAVNRLLKKYDAKAILNCIQKKHMFSLRPKWVITVIEQEQKRLDQQAKAAEMTRQKPSETFDDIVVKVEKTRKPFKSGISKMIELDGEI